MQKWPTVPHSIHALSSKAVYLASLLHHIPTYIIMLAFCMCLLLFQQHVFVEWLLNGSTSWRYIHPLAMVEIACMKY